MGDLFSETSPECKVVAVVVFFFVVVLVQGSGLKV